MSCRQKLSSRNQGLSRAPGSWKPHFGIGSRSENSTNGMTPPLYPFPLAFQPVHEASCRAPSHYQIQERLRPMLVAAGVAIASRWQTYLATLLAVVLSIQVANVVLTTVVADQSVARTQSPESVTKTALASDVVVVVQVSRQLLTPRSRSPTTNPRKIAQCLAREGQQQSAKEKQQQSQVENS